MLRDRFLGSVSPLVLFDKEAGAGGGGAAADAGAAAAAAGAGAAGAGGGQKADTGAADKAGAADKGAGGAAAATLAGGADSAAAAAAAAVKPGELPTNFDFRKFLAGDDKDAEKDLAKYTDLKAVYKSLRDLQGQVSAGKLKAPAAPLPANATDEQKAEWRKTNGLPENAEGYVKGLALPDGVVVGEADKPLLNDFAKSMFEQGASQTEMNRAVNWFFAQQQQVEAQRAEADGNLRIASEVALRQEWGQDYKPNMNAMGTLLDSMPEDLRVGVLTARTNDGRMIGNTPEFIKWAAQFAREANPTATIVAPGADATKTIETELATIKETYGKAMAGDSAARRAYYGHDGKPGLDARERELIDAQQKMAARGKAA